MSDIIKRAKRLFENRYHDEPWLALFDSSQERFWVETDNFAEVCGDFVSEDDTRLAAAAPEMAQALAEETWEYAVQIERSDGWEYTRKPWESRWLQNYDAQLKHVQRGFPGEKTRIMRRRVSPPEAINE